MLFLSGRGKMDKILNNVKIRESVENELFRRTNSDKGMRTSGLMREILEEMLMFLETVRVQSLFMTRLLCSQQTLHLTICSY